MPKAFSTSKEALTRRFGGRIRLCVNNLDFEFHARNRLETETQT
jgi:hypothetical protein